MEMRAVAYRTKTSAMILFISLFMLFTIRTDAQLPGSYNIKNGKMYIQIAKGYNEKLIDSFLTKFQIADLPLKQFMKTGIIDSLNRLGWKLESNTKKYFVISKPINAINNNNNPADRIIFAGKTPNVSELYPLNARNIIYGYNRFRNNNTFAVNGNTVTFICRAKRIARQVTLAGSFNNWSPNALPMLRTDSGWIAKVKLEPGKHWYKFIIDGNWEVDADNLIKEDDGQGNTNSVYFKTNVLFRLDNPSYKKVFIAGSFNNWKPNEIAMWRIGNGWQFSLYLSEGTHTYKFVADGKWLADPSNNVRLPDGVNAYNSVITIGKPHVFRLPGYSNAKQVILTGSFNGWKRYELLMKKTSSGWELPYVIGAGNYEYQFIVDGKSVTDPSNPLLTTTGKDANSFLIIKPNYTFRLKGFANAKTVVVSGDFSNWSPTMLVMKREGNEWSFPVHLSVGKHLYKFVVDGNWIIDPGNKLWEQNEFGTGNSVIWKEEAN